MFETFAEFEKENEGDKKCNNGKRSQKDIEAWDKKARKYYGNG